MPRLINYHLQQTITVFFVCLKCADIKSRPTPLYVNIHTVQINRPAGILSEQWNIVAPHFRCTLVGFTSLRLFVLTKTRTHLLNWNAHFLPIFSSGCVTQHTPLSIIIHAMQMSDYYINKNNNVLLFSSVCISGQMHEVSCSAVWLSWLV